MRAFIAIDLPKELLEEISKLQKTIEAENILSARWVNPKNSHLTLKFLGEINEKQVTNINEILASVCNSNKKFKISFKGLNAFPSQSRVNVLWIGASDGDDVLKSIQKSIDEKLAVIGFTPEKNFVSHLTLARVKSVQDTSRLKNLFKKFDSHSLAGFNIEKISLIKSTLTPTGPIYETICEFHLV